MQTLTKLNGYEFIIVVLGADIEISPGPRYQATCDSKIVKYVQALQLLLYRCIKIYLVQKQNFLDHLLWDLTNRLL